MTFYGSCIPEGWLLDCTGTRAGYVELDVSSMQLGYSQSSRTPPQLQATLQHSLVTPCQPQPRKHCLRLTLAAYPSEANGRSSARKGQTHAAAQRRSSQQLHGDLEVDLELREVLEMADDDELEELHNILYGKLQPDGPR